MLQVWDAHVFAPFSCPAARKLLHADWTGMSQSLHATHSEVSLLPWMSGLCSSSQTCLNLWPSKSAAHVIQRGHICGLPISSIAVQHCAQVGLTTAAAKGSHSSHAPGIHWWLQRTAGVADSSCLRRGARRVLTRVHCLLCRTWKLCCQPQQPHRAQVHAAEGQYSRATCLYACTCQLSAPAWAKLCLAHACHVRTPCNTASSTGWPPV